MPATISPDARPWLASIPPVEPEHLEGDLIRPDHPLFGLVWINPQRVSGTPCFYASRVPIKNLFDYLEGGDTLEIFLDDFPTVTRGQVLGVLELSRDTLLSQYEIAA